MSVKESSEANLIYKSISQVQLFIDDVRGRHYKMKCDVQPLTDNNPTLLRTHKTFLPKSNICVQKHHDQDAGLQICERHDNRSME